jgi:16S rRNA (cytidine1402-2'-O)-methyltransferase
MYQEVKRGTLGELAEWAEATPPRGEIVIVVGGAVGDSREVTPPEELARRARALMEEGVERKEALAKVARESGVAKREVFDALVEES